MRVPTISRSQLAVLVVCLSTLNALPAHATPRLSESPLLIGCPFDKKDEYSMDGLLNLVASELQEKIEQNRQCLGSFNKMQSDISAIQNYFTQINPEVAPKVAYPNRAQMSLEVYSSYLMQLQLRVAQLEAAKPSPVTADYQAEYSRLVSLIDQTEKVILDSTIESGYNEENNTTERTQMRLDQIYTNRNFRKTREASFRGALFERANGLVSNLASAEPHCFSVLGEWNQLAGSVLGLAAIGTGYGTFANQELVGSALALASNLISLLQDRVAKSAYNDLLRYKNSKILACTYYSIKYSACEVERAAGLARDEKEKAAIIALIERRFSNPLKGDYEQFFEFQQNTKSTLRVVFDVISSMGSPLTLNLDQIFRYISAKRANPSTLPAAPGATASVAAKKEWLREVQARGIEFSEYANGVRRSVDEQIDDAQKDISGKVADIQNFDEFSKTKLSFEELRNELNSNPKFRGLKKDVTALKLYIEKYADLTQQFVNDPDHGAKNSFPVSPEYVGSLMKVRDIVLRLETYLAVTYKYEATVPPPAVPSPTPPVAPSPTPSGTPPTPVPAPAPVTPPPPMTPYEYSRYLYRTKLNEAGYDLFKEMSDGSIPQLSSQSLLALSGKTQDSMQRAFGTIENHFLQRDMNLKLPKSESYSEYKKNRALIAAVTENYTRFHGPNAANITSDVHKPLINFERGFEREIVDMVKEALNERLEMLESLKGARAAQYCALFSGALQKSSAGRRLLAKCQERFTNLELIDILPLPESTAPKAMKINYADPCFYSNYVRTFQMQELLFRQYQESHKDSQE